MISNFLFNVTSLVIYRLVFGDQQVGKGFWFLDLLFCGVGVLSCMCECCCVFFANRYFVVGRVL
jgi:hypothetical protein